MKRSSLASFFLGTVCTAVLFAGAVTVRAAVLRGMFPDVTGDRSYSVAVERYARLGIFQGYESGVFGPGESLKRSEIALILQRMEEMMVQPLREQMDQIRHQLELGRCGDGTLQTGEACDDGNTFDNDGCSAECLKEVRFSSSGTIPRSSSSSSQLQASSSSSSPAVAPIGAKAGSSSSSSTSSSSTSITPSTTRPICGNGICEYHEDTIPPDPRFYCIKDCTEAQPERMCNALTTQALTLTAADLNCKTKDDCTLIEQSCPFLTCGIPVNKSSYAPKVLEIRTAVNTCKNEGMITDCVLCPYISPYCENERCVLKYNQR